MYNNCRDCDCNHEDSKDELMKKIMEYKFAIIELALYLDTHPTDNKALCMHNDYTRKCKELTDKYQKLYGPLTIDCPCNKWRWIEMPWPWERRAN